jgi:hypothetical protein
MTGSDIFRIGCGAGFSSDRLDPALDLARRGRLHVLVFECVGERTLAFGHRHRLEDPAHGYNPLLERRLRAVLPLARTNGTRIVTNMGVANPRAAAERTIAVARELGLTGLKVAAVLGDDVGDAMTPETELWEPACTVAEVGRPLIGANAYLGSDAILPALEAGADVVITGRVADPSLFLAPMAHHFGWPLDDWPRLARGTVVGHLLECAGQVTGGYFADPGFKDVDGLASLGFPLAEVGADGDAVIGKLDDTGGVVDLRTVKEQLLYEVHDPGAYVTPDVTADFAAVALADDGPDRVRVAGATGGARPESLKATVAFDGGFLAEAEVSYAGPGAESRARLAAEVTEKRMGAVHGLNAPLRLDLIGSASLHATVAADQGANGGEAGDVRLRCAMRAGSREEAELLLWEVEALLCCGPAGGGGYRGHVTQSVMTYSTFLPRDTATPELEVLVA